MHVCTDSPRPTFRALSRFSFLSAASFFLLFSFLLSLVLPFPPSSLTPPLSVCWRYRDSSIVRLRSAFSHNVSSETTRTFNVSLPHTHTYTLFLCCLRSLYPLTSAVKRIFVTSFASPALDFRTEMDERQRKDRKSELKPLPFSPSLSFSPLSPSAALPHRPLYTHTLLPLFSHSRSCALCGGQNGAPSSASFPRR